MASLLLKLCLLCLAISAQLTSSQDLWTVTEGYYCPGGVYSAAASDVDGCKAACIDDDECSAFDWETYYGGWCYLKAQCDPPLLGWDTVTHYALNRQRLNCPDDFTYSAGGCHKVGTTNKDWENAAAGCRSMNENAHLLVIDNEAEQLAIVDMMGSINSTAELSDCFVTPTGRGIAFWTAGQRFNTTDNTSRFVWRVMSADGSSETVSELSYTNWYPERPNGIAGDMCINIWELESYQWNDGRCHKERCYFCEIDI